MVRNIGSNWGLAAIQVFVMIYVTTTQVNALHETAQGTWLTISSATSILGLLILGVPMASVRFIAGHVARKDPRETNAAIATCLGICLGLSAITLVVSGGLWVFFEHNYLQSAAWRTLDPALIRQARVAFWLSVAQVALGFPAQLPFGILDAHDGFLERNGVKIAGIALRVILIAGVLTRIPSLIVVALIQCAVTALEFGVCMVIIRRSWPEIRFGLRGFDQGRLRAILGFSLFAMLLNVGSQLSFQSDQLVINHYASPDEGTFFDVGNKFFPPLLQLILGIGMVMMPAAAKLQATGDIAELRRVFLKWSKVAYSLALLVGVYLLVLAPEFLAWWMGPSYALNSGRVTRVIMLSFLLFLPVRGVAAPMLMGLGKPVLVSFAFLGMGAINLGLSIWLMAPLGIFGVAVGTAIPCGLFALGVAWLGCREIDVSFSEYLGYVMVRPTLGVIPPILLLYLLKRGLHIFHIFASRWTEFFPLLFSGLVMVGSFFVMWAVFVYRNDPYVDFSSRFERFFPRALRRKTN